MSTSPPIGVAHCIEITGAHARRFAQVQFSGDVDALAPGHWQWNAWLTPQGRVRALMHLADPGDGRLVAVLRGGDAMAIHAELARFLLRVDAVLSLRTLGASRGGPLAEGTVAMEGDAVLMGYGSRSLRLAPENVVMDPASVDTSTGDAWRRDDIVLGWPTLPADGPLFLPPALGLEHLGAVAFGKGCYPGQEIAARLHYRGGHKYQLAHLAGPIEGSEPPQALLANADCRVLDAVAVDGRADVLVVGPLELDNRINVIQHIYRVVSRFDS